MPRAYEFTAYGFNGNDTTDGYVFWVRVPETFTDADARALAEQYGARAIELPGSVANFCDAGDFDFALPGDAVALAEQLALFAAEADGSPTPKQQRKARSIDPSSDDEYRGIGPDRYPRG